LRATQWLLEQRKSVSLGCNRKRELGDMSKGKGKDKYVAWNQHGETVGVGEVRVSNIPPYLLTS